MFLRLLSLGTLLQLPWYEHMHLFRREKAHLKMFYLLVLPTGPQLPGPLGPSGDSLARAQANPMQSASLEATSGYHQTFMSCKVYSKMQTVLTIQHRPRPSLCCRPDAKPSMANTWDPSKGRTPQQAHREPAEATLSLHLR